MVPEKSSLQTGAFWSPNSRTRAGRATIMDLFTLPTQHKISAGIRSVAVSVKQLSNLN